MKKAILIVSRLCRTAVSISRSSTGRFSTGKRGLHGAGLAYAIEKGWLWQNESELM
jgi:hypothetical protein